MPPSGRATNPTAYVTNAAMMGVSGSSDGGNMILLKTRVAAVA